MCNKFPKLFYENVIYGFVNLIDVKWFSGNGTNPSTGELFDPYKPLYKPFQQKEKMARLPILYWSLSSGPTGNDRLFWEQFPYK